MYIYIYIYIMMMMMMYMLQGGGALQSGAPTRGRRTCMQQAWAKNGGGWSDSTKAAPPNGLLALPILPSLLLMMMIIYSIYLSSMYIIR